MQARSSFLLLALGAAACGEVQKFPSDGSVGDAPVDVAGPAAECTAQRMVHIVAGNGGFAWFTLAWPAPTVIAAFQPAFAYDDPASAKDVAMGAGHPLFTRRIGARSIWEGVGMSPQPTVFVAGSNETHTATPQTISINSMVGLDAAAAALQEAALRPTFAALQISPSGPFGTAPGAPTPVLATNVDGAIAAFQGMITPAQEQELRPTPAQLARYLPLGGLQVEVNFATQLAFAANAFRLGLLGTVIMPAFNDDPHGAFTDLMALTRRANNLATTLDAFYADLAPQSEATCGRGGNFLSLADNVVLVVSGDTPKNSFNNQGWPDGTPGNSNWMYVRSNGFLQPGWFGQVTTAGRTLFNPNTGALDANATLASSTGAAFAGALYAVARGDGNKVTPFTAAPFGGVILR